MDKTTNYGLNKPEKTDYYNVDDFNGNADIIDAELAARLKQYRYLPQVQGFTNNMTTQAFLEAMPAFTSIIAIGNDQANFSDAPTTYGLYQFIKGSNDNYMVGKCFGVGLNGEYYYAWSDENDSGLGWVKNVKSEDLDAYVPMSGAGHTSPMTGPIYMDHAGLDYMGRFGVYHGSTQDYVTVGILPKGTNTVTNKFNLFPDGTASVNDKEIWTTGNTNQTLRSGSWSQGNITVPNFNKYNLFKFTFEDSGTVALVTKHGQYIRGIGGYIATTGSGVIILAFTGTYSGNTLTFSYAKNINVGTGNGNDIVVSSIIGII